MFDLLLLLTIAILFMLLFVISPLCILFYALGDTPSSGRSHATHTVGDGH